MNDLIEQMAAKSPPGPPCPSCGAPTRLVVPGETWCSRCQLFRPWAAEALPIADGPRPDAEKQAPAA